MRYAVANSTLRNHGAIPKYVGTKAAGLIAQGDRLYIPEFCLLECTNVLWKHVRFDGLPQADAVEIITDLLKLPFQIVAVHPLLSRALQIGLTNQLAVYDSLYIALALELDCPLITVDTRQATAAIASGATLKAITDFSPP
ncbi:type II toxin-antitoxin system VapC family toxin [Kovacikia minuta CCNUW1]|uniref:type II toxin-antitoxin system VapC family toxin n=1 Tax=Kovacikia minuta TaxID=2931930 RepID=UPI001CCEBF50|nr:type II toxin-antitoxin system VapC family toxin [Kovacikia minuta]UBF24989.1 type II toxin-antitoxin system VapC family toxin [Kovacikia minuta CCNUW1]